jgi:hypothetical protein
VTINAATAAYATAWTTSFSGVPSSGWPVADLDEARTRVAAAGTAVEKMDVLMDYVLDDASDDASALWLEAWSLGRRNAPLAAEAKELTDEWLSVIGETVRIGTGDGEFRVADVDVAARRLLTVIDGLGAQKVVRAVPSEEAKHIARGRTSPPNWVSTPALNARSRAGPHDHQNRDDHPEQVEDARRHRQPGGRLAVERRALDWEDGRDEHDRGGRRQRDRRQHPSLGEYAHRYGRGDAQQGHGDTHRRVGLTDPIEHAGDRSCLVVACIARKHAGGAGN